MNQTFSGSFEWFAVGRGLASWESELASERFDAFTLSMECTKSFDATVLSSPNSVAFHTHGMTGGVGASYLGNGVEVLADAELTSSEPVTARFGQPIASGQGAAVSAIQLEHPNGSEEWMAQSRGDFFAYDGGSGRYQVEISQVTADSAPLVGFLASFSPVTPANLLSED